MMGRYMRLLVLCLIMLSFPVAVAVAAGEADGSANGANGTLSGQFMLSKLVPLANGRLFVYNKALGPPSADSYIRVPDQITGLDGEGKFLLNLPAGTYYLSAVAMPVSGAMGPPAEGELIYFGMDTGGNIQPLVVTAGKKTDVGVISSSRPYKRHQSGQNKDGSAIEGVVTDAEGAPVEGAVIYVYVTPGIEGKAYYVSEKTVKDGKFVLRVSQAGSYYLRVRSDYGGGTPKDGDLVSLNDPKELVGVTVKKGEKLSGVSIRVKRLQRGPLFQSK